MKAPVPTRRPLLVALGFLVFVGLSVFASYLVGLRPTQAQACQKTCAALGKAGELAYNGPLSSKPRNPVYDPLSECQCK